MPRYDPTNMMAFDFAAWRAKCKLGKTEAAAQLGISKTQYWRLERAAAAPRIYVWACYGLAEWFGKQKVESAPE